MNPEVGKKIKNYTILAVVLLVLVIIIVNSVTTVRSGSVGISYTMGAIQPKYLPPGFHFKIPFATQVVSVSTQTKKVQIDASAASKDMQVLATVVAVNYHVDPNSAATLYSNVGRDYESTIIIPAIQESVKSVTAKFSAEELITRRQEVSIGIKEELTTKFSQYGLITDDFNIVNLDFSEEFNAAIEAKQTAQQQALKAEQDLNRIRIEAQQQVEQAKAGAEATRATADAEAYSIQKVQEEITNSPEYLEYRKIEKWNGELPMVQGDSTPIIDFRALEEKQQQVSE